MKRARVYISGPISNGGTAGPLERLENVGTAAAVAADLIDAGFAVFCPQLTEYVEILTGRTFPHSVWIENDLPWIEVADAVLRLPGVSSGSDREVEHAMKRGIKVFFTVDGLKAWRSDWMAGD